LKPLFCHKNRQDTALQSKEKRKGKIDSLNIGKGV